MKAKITILFVSIFTLTSMAQINGGFFTGQDMYGNYYVYFQGTNVINSPLKIEILTVNEQTRERKSWNCNLGVNKNFTIGPADNWFWMPGEKLIINYPNGKSVFWVYAPNQNININPGRTKAEIDMQINKIERNLRDVRQNYENCTSVTLKPSYYQMILKYEEMLRNLRTERIYAR